MRLGVVMVFVEYKDLMSTDDPEDGRLTEWVPIKVEFASTGAGKKNSKSGGGKQKRKTSEADDAEVGFTSAASLTLSRAVVCERCIHTHAAHVVFEVSLELALSRIALLSLAGGLKRRDVRLDN